MSAMQFLNKVVRMRKRLLKEGKSKRNLMEVAEALKPVEAWVNAYPNASDAGAMKVLMANYDNVLRLIPGKDCAAHARLMREFNQLTSKQLNLSI